MKKSIIPIFCASVALLALLFSCSNYFEFVEDANDSKYSVVYDKNGADSGTVPPVQRDFASRSISVPANPGNLVKKGYVFSGWNTAKDGSGTTYSPASSLTLPKQDLLLYALWLPATYTVTWDSQDATVAADPVKSSVTTPAVTVASLPAAPRKTGFNFGGWWTKENGVGERFTETSIVESDLTVYAKWTTKPFYTVTFDTLGGSSVESQSVEEGQVALVPESPVKTGYLFGGWYADSACAESWAFESTPVTSAVSIFAKWNSYSHAVSFDSQGANTAVSPSSLIVASPAVTLSSLPESPVKTGYSFGGWWSAPEGLGEEFTVSSPVSASLTVYAKWVPHVYTVAFDSQGADTQSSPVSMTVKFPETHIAALPASPVKAGYVFGGWFTEKNGAGQVFTAESTCSGDATVYAKWIPRSFTVSFKTEGSSSASVYSSATVTYPATCVSALPSAPVKTGYIFGGWWTKENGGGNEFKVTTAVSSDTTVFAKWNTYSYTVTFDGQDASTEASPAVKTVASPATSVGSLPVSPNKTGYTFSGWYTQENGLGDLFTAATLITSDKTVYAKWTPISYIVTYDVGTSSVPEVHLTKTVTYPETTVGSLPSAPAKTGYLFGGWFTGENGAGTEFTSEHTITTNSLVYAYWLVCNSDGSVTIGSYTGTLNPDGTLTIGAYTGSETEVVIPSSVGGLIVTGIADRAFWASDITSIIIPDSITTIGNNAFTFCSGLTSITIPDSVTSIGEYAFSYCSGLTSITIPDSVTSIGSDAFAFCEGLTSITIPDSVTSIGGGSFYGCRRLTSITIPDSVTSIGQSAFNSCIGLTSITIPDSVTSIGGESFSRCSGLTSITIPDSVTSIGVGSFRGCSGLTSITIPDSVTSIESFAFDGCNKLTSITIPDSVTSIGEDAFSYCSGLTSITIPDSVTSIGEYAFSRCSSLETIIVMNPIPSILGTDAFKYINTGYVIKVPAGTVDAYKAAPGWSVYADHIVSQ